MRWFTKLVARSICGFARLLTGAQAVWRGCEPSREQRIYFANHTSHGDFVLIWASLPQVLRPLTRPVAGADYWEKTALRRWLIDDVLHAVLIARVRTESGPDPIRQMLEPLQKGESLILFPEGTRNTTDEILLPFRSGIYHLVAERPDVQCVPVWIENLNRVMPKGEFMPIPLLCTLTFGTPLTLQPGETKAQFVERARVALLSLCPPRG
jgi:1-acyl-sn-glycerol-3-phosphate acyltransferase